MKPASVYPKKLSRIAQAPANDDIYMAYSEPEDKTYDFERQLELINKLLNVYHASMINADIESLNKILDTSFYLVHVTGYKQPRYEWLEYIRCGDFDYHKISFKNRKPKITILKNSWQALIEGVGNFDATIHGMTNPWVLDFSIKLEKKNNIWKFVSADYNIASPSAYF